MCNYPAPKQFAYVDATGFHRLKTPIRNEKQMRTCIVQIPYESAYESVYGWTGWHGGKITPRISRTADMRAIFLDFDDKENPLKAIRDAAEVAAYVGHCTTNFSGAKGAHVLIHCYPVDLIPDLKSSVIRQFVDNLVDVLPELDTLDFAVVGDTSRVHRIIDSVHPRTKLHAIGLTADELATLTIDEIKEMAANRRGLVQVPEPSQWVTDELYRIEGEIIIKRIERLYEEKMLAPAVVERVTGEIRYPMRTLRPRITELYESVCKFEEEMHRIRRASIPPRSVTLGATAEETWLIYAVKKFKATGRAASTRPQSDIRATDLKSPKDILKAANAHGQVRGNRRSEHKARVHLAKLADECGWTFGEICDIYTGADDYDRVITERMVRSCIGRR